MTASEIKQMRLALGLTQSQFAALIPAVSLRTLQGWESGRYTPRPATLEYVRDRVRREMDRRQLEVEQMLESPEWETRQIAVSRLDPIKHDGVLAGLALYDPHPEVRWAAVGKVADAQCVRQVALADPEWFVRKAAVQRLDVLHDRDILAKIAREDDDHNVRSTAESMLGRVREAAEARLAEAASPAAGRAWTETAS